MRKYLAERGGIKPTNEFGLIALLGEDLPGAVVVASEHGDAIDAGHPIADASGEKPFHFSLAGIQLKFSAIAGMNGGLTIPVKGVGGDWIIKLPAQNYAHVPENEFAMMQLAGIMGIPVPETRLVPLDDIGGLPEMGTFIGTHALAVKRFDRQDGGRRIHIEDFAQVFNVFPHDKYDNANYGNIARMVWMLTGNEGLQDFIRRLSFSILIGNGDMHLKNWSFIYEDGRTPNLSPAYDMVSTIPYIPNDGLALNLAGTKAMQAITLDHFKKLAEKARLPEALILQTVRDTSDATITAWEENHMHWDMPSEIRKRIHDHMQIVPLKHA
jgi:serine/threonine-protein kinase HipA